MGKRELLLIVGFLVVGAVVYQATAPPPGPNDRSLSLSRVIDHVRRELRGNRASTVITSTSTIPIERDVNELRVIGFISEVDIVGEDRSDVEAALTVHSNAYDDAEAKQFAERTVLKPDHAGTSLALRVDYPREGRQRATLALKIPARFRARIESRPGKLSIANLAGLETTNSGGETQIKNITGRVSVSHRGGSISIEDVAILKFTGRSSDVKVVRVAGDTSIVMEQGGELTATHLAGPVDVECRNADVALEHLESTRGPIRVNATNGRVTIKGLSSEARVDGRNAELIVVIEGAAPIAIYNEGDDVELTPPSGGFRLDATVVDGKIAPESVLKDLGLQLSTDADTKEARATGAARGGGPTITVRANRGDLTLRARDKLEK